MIAKDFFSKCHVLQQLGKRLQKCNVSYKRDHYPLYLEYIVRFPVQSVPKQLQFDKDKIMLALHKDRRLRHDFLEAVESNMASFVATDAYSAMVQGVSPEQIWNLGVEKLQGVASSFVCARLAM